MPQSSSISISLESSRQAVQAGSRAEFIFTVQNTSDESQSQSVELTGLPDAWYRITYDTGERAAPGEVRSGTVVITPPGNLGGGTYDFDVSVLSGSAESSASGTVEIVTGAVSAEPSQPAPAPATPAPSEPSRHPPGDAVAPAVTLESGLIIWHGSGQSAERKALTIRNDGTSETDYVLEVSGLETGWFTVLNRFRISGGQELRTDFTVHPPAGARRQEYPFQIVVRVEGRPELESEVSGWLSLPGGSSSTPAPAPTPATPAEPAPAPVSHEERVTPPDVVLSPRSNYHFGPGEPVAQALVTVYNRGQTRERFRIVVNGIPEDWYRLSDAEVRLDPGESQQLSLRLSPVTGPGLPAGEYEFTVRALPDTRPDAYGEVLGVASITGRHRYEAVLEPLQAEGTKKSFTARVENMGDLPLLMTLVPSDPESRCKFKVPAPRNIEPGQVGAIEMKVGAKRQGLFGPPETFDFRVQLQSEDQDVETSRDTLDGRFIHHPKIPYRWVFLTGFFCALVGLVFLIVWLLTPVFEDAATWVGCQLDSDYRLSSDTLPVRKEECGGRPRQDEVDDWTDQKLREIEQEQEQDQDTGSVLPWQVGPVPLVDRAAQPMDRLMASRGVDIT